MAFEQFEDTGYLIIPKILSRELLDFIDVYAYNIIRVNEINGINIRQDPQVPNTPSLYREWVMENLSDFLLPKIESVTGMKLLPTYTYFRIYKAGDILEKHIDRPACEISVTLSLRKEGKIWPIYINNTDYKTRKSDKVEFTPLSKSRALSREETLERMHKEHIEDTSSILLEEGDAVIYKGCEIVHWREPYNEGTKLTQTFLHYVDANGRFSEWENDKSLDFGWRQKRT